jgi:hypothetical protein
MIRKQIYLAREQDRKLKALAAHLRCSEAEVIRDALDRLPDPAGSIEERLAAAGLLAPTGDVSDAPVGAELRALEAEVEAWLDAHPAGLGLSEAVREDRNVR